MKTPKTFLVIIPARGGSKGIKDKNIADIGGVPLLVYTIRAALPLQGTHGITQTIVSTDSPKIANIAEEAGVDVPFLRPAELATDQSKGVEYRLHAIEFFEKRGMTFDAVVVLQPTSPLRTTDDIVAAIALFQDNECESLFAAYQEETIRDVKMYRKAGKNAIPLSAAHNTGARRQDYEPLYILNVAIFITAVNYLQQTRKTISETPLLYEMPKRRSINIDTPEDLYIARALAAYQRLMDQT